MKNIFYCTNGSEVKIYNSFINVEECGKYSIEYWSEDKLGNKGIKVQESIKIDKILPHVKILYPDGGIYFNGKKIAPIDRFSSNIHWNTPIIFGKISILVNATDIMSGIQSTQFYLDGDLQKNDNEYPYQWTWDKRAIFKHEIKIICYDNAGNFFEIKMKVLKLI